MLNGKRMKKMKFVTSLTIVATLASAWSVSEQIMYESPVSINRWKTNRAQASEIHNLDEIDLQQIKNGELGVPYVDDDPGRERLMGEADLWELEEHEMDISKLLLNTRAISGYSPFMGNTPYFHNDVFADRKVVHGIDVSKYQKDIDWQTVAKAGVDYAIIRVGYRGYGKTGGMGADNYFEQNVKGALEAGIDVGVYFFSQATTKKEAIEEAEYTLNKIKGYDIKLPVVMDFEYASVNGKEGGRLYDANLSKKEATDVCLAFCETVEKAGYEPMVYANSSMLKNKVNASDISNKYKIWLANYTTMTAYTGEYDFWQYTSKGTVNGIIGNVDCNFWYQEVIEETPELPEEPEQNPEEMPEQPEEPEQNPEETPEFPEELPVKPEQTPELPEELPETPQQPIILPEKVNEFTVGGRTNSKVRLNWQEIENASGYRIYRYDEVDGKYKKVKTISNKMTTTWVDTTVEAGNSYEYVIKSYIKNENGTYWSEKSLPLIAKTRTDVVEGFELTVARKDKVRLSWKQTKGADGYRIYRYNSKTNTYEKIKTIGKGDIVTWVNSGLERSTTYKYKIKAYIEVENGNRYVNEYSNEVIAKTEK